MSLLVLDVQLVLQFCLFLSDKVWLFDDFMIILHNICQILINRSYKKLLASATALETSVQFFSVFCEVLFFIRVISTEW